MFPGFCISPCKVPSHFVGTTAAPILPPPCPRTTSEQAGGVTREQVPFSGSYFRGAVLGHALSPRWGQSQLPGPLGLQCQPHSPRASFLGPGQVRTSWSHGARGLQATEAQIDMQSPSILLALPPYCPTTTTITAFSRISEDEMTDCELVSLRQYRAGEAGSRRQE